MSQNQNPAIILIGKKGSGKSTFGNWLYNLSLNDTNDIIEVFEVEHEVNTETKNATSKTIMLEGKAYDLFDMPGFSDTNGMDVQIVDEISRISAPFVQAVLFVIEYGRITPELYKEVDWVEKNFGPEVMANVILVISKVNVKQTQDREFLRKALETDPTGPFQNPLKDLLRKVGHRWIISPNPDIFQSRDDPYWLREAEILTEKIQAIQQPYTNEVLKCYREELNRQEKEEAEKKKYRRNRNILMVAAVMVGAIVINTL